jgi:hypothetical protein
LPVNSTYGCGTATASQICPNQIGDLGHTYSLLNNGSLIVTLKGSTPDQTPLLEAGKPSMKSRNIGLGVGLGVGIPVVALACFLVWRMTRRSSLPLPKVLDEEDA